MDFGARINPAFFLFLMRAKLKKVNLRRAVIGRGVEIAEGVMCFNDPEIFGKVTIGKYSSICGPATRICSGVNSVTIGAYCSIASNVIVQEYYHNPNRASTYGVLSTIFNDKNPPGQKISKGAIVIEDDVWIGSNAVVLSGVKIGRGAVIGAGAVVTKDVESYTIVGGNPARVIRKRFSSETIDELEASGWWEWPLERVLRERNFFEQDRI